MVLRDKIGSALEARTKAKAKEARKGIQAEKETKEEARRVLRQQLGSKEVAAIAEAMGISVRIVASACETHNSALRRSRRILRRRQ